MTPDTQQREQHQLPALPTTISATPSVPHTLSKVLRRACDCCRKRKVRCDGTEPCSPCKKASIRCAYLQPPRKKGPKGLRSSKVLHALRRVEDTSSGSPTNPPHVEQHGAFGGCGWASQNTSPTAPSYSGEVPPAPPEMAFGPHANLTPDQSYLPLQIRIAMPAQPLTRPPLAPISHPSSLTSS